MRTAWRVVSACLMVWTCSLGCETTRPDLKPDLPAEFTLPPENDPRFSAAPTFPKETLNTGPVKKTAAGQPPGGGMRAPGRMGGPGGIGGGGY